MIRQVQPLITEIGPEHAGMHFNADDFDRLEGREGFRYELIDGVLIVSPVPDPLHMDATDILADLIRDYRRPDGRRVFARVAIASRIIVRDEQTAMTNPQPDVSAYLSWPRRPPKSFRGVLPALVVEVVSLASNEKDYERNVELFARVPEIREYWVLDPTRNREFPALTVFQREAGATSFERIAVAEGGTHESTTWPGLRIDLSRFWPE